ncbi:MAG TPA: hypothetical protein VNA25_04560 [Phycisphaerae bacterium]|nr:hypothetical protein [Phycisphaerae bacterium]
MGNYSVIGADGNVYGPVDEVGLQTWAQTGRIRANTQVSVTETGQTVSAMSLDFLVPCFRAAPPVPYATPMGYGLARPGTPEAAAHQFTEFPAAVAILLHFLTLGLFSTIWLNLMHGKMPKIRHDDPSAGKAIGFLFIPFFNLYWVFFTYHRLCRRINEQREMRRLKPNVPAGLAVAMCIIMLIPYVGLIAGLIITPIFLGVVQSSVNELARVSRGV